MVNAESTMIWDEQDGFWRVESVWGKSYKEWERSLKVIFVIKP